jgi:putative transposase
MKLSYKYRIYPNKKQVEVLEKNFNFCRYLYNCALQERKNYYLKFKKSRTYNVQSAELPEVKAIFKEDCKTLYSQTIQQVLKRLDLSYQNFFRRVKDNKLKGEAASAKVGFPRYKSADRFRSITFPQANLKSFGIKLLANKKLAVFGLPGEVKVKWHRELPKEARCKQVQIVKQHNEYYVVLCLDEVAKQLLPKTKKTVGIDLGLINFITMDDGTKFHHPKPYKTSKEKLAYRQRKLAAKQRGSKNRQVAKRLVAKTYSKITNIRTEFHHKTAKQLVSKYDKIIIEKLNIKKMLEAKGFEVNKSNIQDASWGNFVAILKYKAERAGKSVIEVNPRNTSKMCFKCKSIDKQQTLKDREYNCVACGNAIDRDVNAAKNIKRLGTSRLIKRKI